MAALSIRGVDDRVREKLRQRAAAHGRSMEAEVRAILSAAVGEPTKANLVIALSERVRALGGVDLDIPARSDQVRAPLLP